MDNKTIISLVVCFVVGCAAFYGGFITSQKIQPTQFKGSVYSGNVSKDMPLILSQIGQNGGRVTISMEEGKTPSYEFSDGTKISAYDKTDASRIMSMFGLSAGEVIAKNQGIMIDGDKLNIGQEKGFGILEQLWVKIKDFFKIGLLIIVILCILLLVPQTRGIAGWILRAIASVIPFFGSIVERIFAYFKSEKPLYQTIQGGQNFKDNIAKADYLTEEQKAKVKADFNKSQQQTQDITTQKQIQNVKTEKGL
jgi:hypothetical protein